MSLKQSQDPDCYTPPDFIQNLLKRNLSSTTTFGSSQHLQNHQDHKFQTYQQNRFISSLTNIPLEHPKDSENIRSTLCCYNHYEGQNSKIWLTKFKIFFKASFGVEHPQDEAYKLWERFQNCIDNPFNFDKLIEDIISQRNTNIKKNENTEINLSHSASQRKSKSQRKTGNIQKHQRSLSTPKRNSAKSQKQTMYQESLKLKKVMQHGHNFIKSIKI